MKNQKVKSVLAVFLSLCIFVMGVIPAFAAEDSNGNSAHVDAVLSDDDLSKEITSLKFNFGVVNLGLGERLELKLTNQDNEIISEGISYYSSDSKSVSVSDDGAVTGKKLCKNVTVTAKAPNGVSASCTVNVNSPCKYLSLSINRATVNVGENQINIDYQVHGGSARGIKWTSSDESIAITDENGIITGVSEGACTITAETFNGKTAKCLITVSSGDRFTENKATSLKFQFAVLNLGLGEVYNAYVTNQDGVEATNLRYTSSNKSIFDVNDKGAITAKKAGTATLVAETVTGVKAQCTVNVKNPCRSLSLNIVSAKINVGENRVNIDYQVHGGAARGIKWTSSDESIATTDSNGIITGVSEGTCTITAETFNGKTAKCEITVGEGKEEIDYNYTSLSFLLSTVNLGLGEELQLYVKNQNGEYVTDRLTFSTSNKSVASISSNGVVKGNKLGQSVKITVTSDNGKTAQCTVNVKNPCRSLSLNIVSAKINVGENRVNIDYQLHGGAARGIKWTSSDERIATTDSNGIITGVSEGTCTITAETFNGKTAKCEITVGEGKEEIDYNYTSLSFLLSTVNLGLGEELQLYVKNQNGEYVTDRLTFSTSNKSVASISSNGVVKGNKLGQSVKITVTSDNGKTAQCTVNVKNPCQSISLNVTNAVIGVGEKSLNIDYKVHGGAARGIRWTSSDERIATTDSNGIITGVSEGTCTITAKTFNGKKATAKITVKKAPSSIKINNSNNKIQLGTEMYKISYSLDSGAASYKMHFYSSNKDVATINSNGVIKGHKNGETVITVKSYNGITEKITVKVVNENNCLTLNRVATQISYDYDNVTKTVYGKSTQGRNLEAYIITPANGKYRKTYVMTFAIHGFEDSYARDGQLLTAEGNKLVEYYAKNPAMLGNFRLVIIPCLNPDGTIAGKNNYRETSSSAFGRCTAAHIDMNRDFPRCKAVESKAFRDFLKKYKPDLFTDFHGWLNKTIGTSKMVQVFNKNLNLTYSSSNEFYGGYLYAYVHNTYKCPSSLVEYRSTSTVDHKKTYSAINELLRVYK